MGIMERREIELTVCGEKLRIKCAESEGYIKRVAEYVEGRVREFPRDGDGRAVSSIALLYAAINIADELFKLAKEHETLKTENQKNRKELRDFIDILDRNKQAGTAEVAKGAKTNGELADERKG